MGKMSLSIYMKGDYEEFHALRRQKNKANLRIGGMSLSIYMKGDYEEFHALKAAKNKPNSKPIKAKQSQFGYFTAENAECAEVFYVSRLTDLCGQ